MPYPHNTNPRCFIRPKTKSHRRLKALLARPLPTSHQPKCSQKLLCHPLLTPSWIRQVFSHRSPRREGHCLMCWIIGNTAGNQFCGASISLGFTHACVLAHLKVGARAVVCHRWLVLWTDKVLELIVTRHATVNVIGICLHNTSNQWYFFPWRSSFNRGTDFCEKTFYVVNQYRPEKSILLFINDITSTCMSHCHRFYEVH